METVLSINSIVSNPNKRAGKPFISGTSIRVMDVAMAMLFHNQSPAEIAAVYGLPLAQVHAALAYYYEHKDAIDEDIRKLVAEAEALKEQRVGSTPPFLFR